MFSTKRFILVASISAVVAASQAQVAFTSFAPGDPYLSGGFISGHNLTTTNWRQTFQFQSGLTGQLESLRFAISHRGGDTDYVVRLLSSDGGEPGSELYRFDLSDSTVDPGHIVQAFAGGGAPTLTAGEFYWFEFFTDSETAYHRFHRTTTALTLPWRGSNNTDSVWEFSNTVSAPAFEVTVVPEPASLAALGLGALALLRRRKRA